MMTSLKRKSDDTESRHVSFPENIVPGNTFMLGGNVFLTFNVYREKILIHIRRYKKFHYRYYPSTEGVTLSPYQLTYLMNSNYLRAKSTDKIKEDSIYEFFIDLPPTLDPVIVHSNNSAGIRDKFKWYDEIIITFTECITLKKDYTCRSGRTYSSTVVLDDEQWDKVFALKNFLIDSICNLRFHELQFKELLEKISGNPAPLSAPDDDMNIANCTLKLMLQSDVYSALSEYEGIYNPLEAEDELLSQNTLRNFNKAVIDFKLYPVVKNFYLKVKNQVQLPLSKNNLMEFVTSHVLDSINIVEMIQCARSDFCSESD